MQPSQHLKNIASHVEKFKGGERVLFDKIVRYYQGKFWSDPKEGEASLQKTSTNFIFAITETALSTLVPPNPQVDAQPRNEANAEKVGSAQGVVNLALDTGRYRRELSFAVQNAVLYGRGPTKTVWDAKRDLPVTRSCDPRTVFFDLTATRPEDIRYWYEATLLSEKQVRARIEQGLYKPDVLERPSDAYPTWMLPETKPGTSGYDDAVRQLKSWQKWWLVYEVYDLEEGKVWHLQEDTDAALLEDDLVYCPYDLLSFNFNGEDCRGLSEIALILSNQEEYNWLETYLLTIQRLQVARIAYDAKALTSDEVANIGDVPIGGAAPFNVPANKTLADCIAQIPMPEPGALAFDILARKREGIAYVSALADAQRGQVVGARTATELALIEGQLRNRLRSRQNSIDELTEAVAAKHLLLSARYMRNPKIQKLVGKEGFLPIDPATLEGVEATFKVVPYSATESNKAVRAEILRSMIEWLERNPDISQFRLTDELLGLLDLDKRVLLTEEERKQMAAAAAAPPAGAPGLPPTPAPVDPNAAALPPQVQALADAGANQAAGAVAPGETPLGGGPATV
jgi:hypothetical protein